MSERLIASSVILALILPMKKQLIALLTGLVMISCVPLTPEKRIAANPAKFSMLSGRQQALVSQGQISKGMPPAAVELAWGRPSQRYEEFKNNRTTQRWEYAGSRLVETGNLYGSYGYGFGGYGGGYSRYGRYGRDYSSVGFGYSQGVVHVPYQLASVTFSNGLVESWERAQ